VLPRNDLSYAGLTRVSINLQKSLAKKMDGRVKPGHDDLPIQQKSRRHRRLLSFVSAPR
jgi:hypothetical protein